LVRSAYEADSESELLFILVARSIESVITLAREDLILYPAAVGITRIVFEISNRVLWLLAPNDDMVFASFTNCLFAIWMSADKTRKRIELGCGQCLKIPLNVKLS
jgi:hypothetical protein